MKKESIIIVSGDEILYSLNIKGRTVELKVSPFDKNLHLRFETVEDKNVNEIKTKDTAV